jgi:hypothetical protein
MDNRKMVNTKNITWIEFNSEYPDHNRLLDVFFTLPNLHINSSSRKSLNFDTLFSHPASRFWLCISNDCVYGMSGIYVSKDDNGILYAKTAYRQFFYQEYVKGLSPSIFSSGYETLMEEWTKTYYNIPAVVTINEGNEKIFFYILKRIQRHQYSPFYLNYLKQFYLYPKYVWEKNTWQLMLLNNYTDFDRKTKPLHPDFIEKVNNLWNKGFWYGACNRTQLC